MATFYADLDVIGTGGDGLTPETAWGYDEFATNVDGNLAGSDVIKVKGKHNYGISSITIHDSAWGDAPSLENWETDPFRIKSQGFQVAGKVGAVGGIIKNAVIYSTSSIAAVGKFYDCFIVTDDVLSPGGVISPRTDSQFVGCIIKANGINEFGCAQTSYDYLDSIIDCLAISNFDSAGSDNCCFTIGSIPGIGVHTDAQVGWTPPTWPAWDAAQSAFSSTLLSVGITTPPEPGNPPYTDYALGLWGSTRTGIGAMDFVGGTTTTTTTEAPTTTTTTTTAGPTTTTEAPTTTSTTLPPDPLDPRAFIRRKSHGPVIIDGGPGGRSTSGNGHEMSDYHAPWWLQ